MNEQLVPMPFLFSVWAHYKRATKDILTEHPQKSNKYMQCPHFIYYTYIYTSIYLFEYQKISVWSIVQRWSLNRDFDGLKSQIKTLSKVWEKQCRFSVALGFVQYSDVCVCVCDKFGWLLHESKGWHHWFEVGWLMDVFQHTTTQVNKNTYINIHSSITKANARIGLKRAEWGQEQG